jgi:LmbE family N-acetylglucosaminyl deacetylase
VNVDLLEVQQAALDVMADVRPQVIVTHDPLGG